MKNIKMINPLVLAYLGDSIYECYIRNHLIQENIPTIKKLQEASLFYVKATNQAKILKYLLNDNFFSSDEINIIKTARNTKGHKAPRGCDIITYKYATAMEALLGYLTLEQNKERILEIMDKVWEVGKCLSMEEM